MKNAKALSVATACSLTMISLPQMDMKISAAGTMRDISTMDVVEEMGIGINLGNTFESCGDWIAQWGDGTPNSYETAWGSPTITQDMIKGIADAGFGVVRIPVAWSNLMAADGTYTISKAYEARVKEVVEWALDTDMYVIMNLHWDGGWLENLPTDYDNVMAKYSAIWTQLCAAFGDYGDKLIFESQNEELGWQTVWNQWGGTEGKDRAYSLCNAVNQKEEYVEPTVRALVNVLGLDEGEIRTRLTSEETKNSQYQILKKQLSMDDKKKWDACLKNFEKKEE